MGISDEPIRYNLDKLAAEMAYLITVSRNHVLPRKMLLATLSSKTSNRIHLVGNLNAEQQKTLSAFPIVYLNENDIDLSGRMPQMRWELKLRELGWYKTNVLALVC